MMNIFTAVHQPETVPYYTTAEIIARIPRVDSWRPNLIHYVDILQEPAGRVLLSRSTSSPLFYPRSTAIRITPEVATRLRSFSPAAAHQSAKKIFNRLPNLSGHCPIGNLT